MREIVLDTETTGLDPSLGHRIVEVGAVELFNRVATGQTFHAYINPQRDVPDEAYRVHGLSTEFLASKPAFTQIANELEEFLADSPLVIHNAEFDLRFLNSELGRLGRAPLVSGRAIDTLLIARSKFPGASNSLDALCQRFRVDASRRAKHGALIDAQILAEVYVELTGGRQSSLTFAEIRSVVVRPEITAPIQSEIRIFSSYLRESEAEAHTQFVEALGPNAVWNQFLTAAGELLSDQAFAVAD